MVLYDKMRSIFKYYLSVQTIGIHVHLAKKKKQSPLNVILMCSPVNKINESSHRDGIMHGGRVGGFEHRR